MVEKNSRRGASPVPVGTAGRGAGQSGGGPGDQPPRWDELADYLEFVEVDGQQVPIGGTARGKVARRLLTFHLQTLPGLAHLAAIEPQATLSISAGCCPTGVLHIPQEPRGTRALGGAAYFVRSLDRKYWTKIRCQSSAALLVETLLDAGPTGITSSERLSFQRTARTLSWHRRISDLRALGLPISVAIIGRGGRAETTTRLHLAQDDLLYDAPTDGLPVVRFRTVGERPGVLKVSMRQAEQRRWREFLSQRCAALHDIEATLGPVAGAAARVGAALGVRRARRHVDLHQTDFLAELGAE